MNTINYWILYLQKNNIPTGCIKRRIALNVKWVPYGPFIEKCIITIIGNFVWSLIAETSRFQIYWNQWCPHLYSYLRRYISRCQGTGVWSLQVYSSAISCGKDWSVNTCKYINYPILFSEKCPHLPVAVVQNITFEMGPHQITKVEWTTLLNHTQGLMFQHFQEQSAYGKMQAKHVSNGHHSWNFFFHWVQIHLLKISSGWNQ